MTDHHKRDWYEQWKAADYSWEGLANKPLIGWYVTESGQLVPASRPAPNLRPASLQDYWRSQENSLIECDGKMWTCIHLPLQTLSGEETNKQSLVSSIWNIVKAKHQDSKATDGLFGDASDDGRTWHPSSIDSRLQLQGAVLPAFEKLRYASLGNWSINARQAHFAGFHNFSGCKFDNGSDFSETFFDQDADFFSSVFLGETSFSDAVFLNGANFWRSRFSSISAFDRTRFLGERTSFWVAEFEKEIRFLSTYFEGKAWFKYTSFKDKAYFSQFREEMDGAIFCGEANFLNANFNDRASFQGAKFESKMIFKGSKFLKSAEFSGCGLPKVEKDWRSAFHGATVTGLFDITGDSYYAISMYDSAQFEGIVLYPRLNDGDLRKEFQENSLKIALSYDNEEKQSALRSLANGAHSLQFAFSANSDKRREYIFHQYEMLTHRHLATTSGSEKIISFLFDALAQYGNAIWRPFIYLNILSVLFSLFFLVIGFISPLITGLHGVSAALVLKGSIQLSMYNTFRPFWYWGIDTAQSAAPQWLIAVAPDVSSSLAQWFIVGILSTIQSILSIACIFLFGYCLRRRFQVR